MCVSENKLELIENKNGIVFSLKAMPGARSNAIRGIENGRLKISVIAVAEKGKANQAVMALLARQLGLANSQLEIVSGQTSSIKKVLVRGVTTPELTSKFALHVRARIWPRSLPGSWYRLSPETCRRELLRCLQYRAKAALQTSLNPVRRMSVSLIRDGTGRPQDYIQPPTHNFGAELGLRFRAHRRHRRCGPRASGERANTPSTSLAQLDEFALFASRVDLPRAANSLGVGFVHFFPVGNPAG
jgi:hypothetical protein